MKLFTLTCSILMLISTVIYAQDTIPNGNFEYWSGYNTPSFWETTNQFLPPGSFTIKKVDSEIDTGFAMRLQTLMLDATLIPGVATLGDLDIGSASGGVPFSERPVSLSGYVKHPSSGDEVSIFIEFLKSGETIGYGVWSTTDSIGEYQPLNIPVTFVSAANPDTLNITIMADPWSPGSSLTVDNLQFNFPLTQIFTEQEAKMSVYPNPCNNSVTIEGNFEPGSKINITDINGRSIKTVQTNYSGSAHQINMGDLSPGIYFIIVQTKNSFFREKIIKNQ